MAVPEAWPVEAQDTVGLSKEINKAADREILDHGSVAMEQHHTRSGRNASFNVVETYAVAPDEHANRRVPAFQLGKYDVAADEEDRHQSYDNENGFGSGHMLSLDILARPNSGSRSAE